MLKRALKMIIAFCLIPVCGGFSRAGWEFFWRIGAAGRSGIFFIGGALLYAVLYFASLKLRLLYVFGHESTHALFTLLCGGSVKSFSVSEKGGSVTATKSNTLISLGPYFFPFYTVLIAAVFFVTAFFYEKIYNFADFFAAGAGFGLALHLFMTFDSLRVEQSDLTRNGYLFSLSLMYLLNVIVLACVMSVIFPRAGIRIFFKDAFLYSAACAGFFAEKAAAFWEMLRNKF